MGRIEIIGKRDVEVRGRGVLDVSNYAVRSNPVHNSTYGVSVKDSTDIRVAGISVRNAGRFWNSLYLASQRIEVEHYSTFSNKVNTDILRRGAAL